MTWDARWLCPTCGRAPLGPDYSRMTARVAAVVQAEREAADLLTGGRLQPGRYYFCANGHRWDVPAESVKVEA